MFLRYGLKVPEYIGKKEKKDRKFKLGKGGPYGRWGH